MKKPVSWDDMLGELSNYYDQEVSESINKMTALLEPVLLLVMGLIVGFIALSVTAADI